MPLSAMMTLAGKDIILFILGPQWTKAGIIFCYFGLSIGIMLIYATQGWLHLSLGRPDRWLRWCIFECIATTAFFIVGLRWGAEGVAIGYAASFYVLLGPCLRYAGRPIKLKLNSIISAVWKYFASSALAGVLSYFILYKIPYLHAFFYKQHVFLKILIASILCGVLYLLLIVLFYQSVSPIKNFFFTARQMLPAKNYKSTQRHEWSHRRFFVDWHEQLERFALQLSRALHNPLGLFIFMIIVFLNILQVRHSWKYDNMLILFMYYLDSAIILCYISSKFCTWRTHGLINK